MNRRICVLIPGFSDGGAQKQCIFLLNEFATREDVDVTLLYLHDGVHSDLLRRDNISIIRVPASSNYDPRNILRIREIITKLKPEILMTWMHACDVYGYFLKRTVPGLRWIMTERDSFYPFDLRFLLRRRLGRYADAIIANSEKGAQYWKQAGARGRLLVVNNIVHSTPTVDKERRPERVITIGRLEPQKNTRTVIQAFAAMAERLPNVTFGVIGEGSERAQLEEIARRSAGRDRIEFLGFRKDVAAQIQASSLVVSMSHHEGLPNVMLESIAGDTLVVASDIPEHRELLGVGYPFYVTDRADPDSVAAAIEKAMGAHGQTSLLDHARQRLANMTPTAVADAYIDAFSQILEAAE